MGLYYFGQVIVARIDDGKGGFKERFAVVISRDEENDLGTDLLVVAITKKAEIPCPAYHHFVHNSYDLDPQTGLSRPSVAKCNWIREIKQDRVIRRAGTIPDVLLELIVTSFDRLQADPDFNDWQ